MSARMPMNSRLRAEGSSRIAVSSRFSIIPLLATGYDSIVGSFGLCSQLIVVNTPIAFRYPCRSDVIRRQCRIGKTARGRRARPLAAAPAAARFCGVQACPWRDGAFASYPQTPPQNLWTIRQLPTSADKRRHRQAQIGTRGSAPRVRKSPGRSRRALRFSVRLFASGAAPLRRGPSGACARGAENGSAGRSAHKAVALSAAAYTQRTPYFRRKPSGARSWARKDTEPRKRKNRRH